jgi:hypothetical protein
MKCSISTFNHKILNLTILIVCRKNLNQSGCTDCKIITSEEEEKVFWCGAWIVVNVLRFNRIRWIGLQYGKV